jgi:hypothetical protein
LLVALASLNNGHNSDLRACCSSVRSSSMPNFVVARPLRPQNAAWWSSFVVNLSNTALGHAPVAKVEALYTFKHTIYIEHKN